MQILIDIPDNLSVAEVDQIMARIESQLQTQTYSIKLEGKPSHETEKLPQPGIQRLLDWCDRHPYTLTGDDIPSREERNAR